ncbi:PPE family protein [Mycobacterium haemophilum]|uniref:PPE family protein n=1 Tax=Mycobacterium haemophilum TaxID=29311 RepID=UPI00143AAB08|nr:PPE family protein [Mycobacterium haemophilum]
MSNFNLLPPEVNVKNISGPGSNPMRTAVAAWDDLARELANAAAQWKFQLQATDAWFRGPAARKFVAAADLYNRWLNTHIETATEIAMYLNKAAYAYDIAVHSMAPTASIVANRSSAWTLKATNLLGQFTTKIMELDQAYQEMWVQNAEAMNQYQYTIFDIMARVEESRISPAPEVILDSRGRVGGFDNSEEILI